MLSYLHSFHAGNFADVHKHWILSLLLRHATKKTTALTYLDTHAGRGEYDLNSTAATKTGEYTTGIARLWTPSHTGPAPVEQKGPNHDTADTAQNGVEGGTRDALAPYLDTVHAFNPASALHRYPGSPLIARHLLRAQDRLILIEAHPGEYRALKQCFATDPRVAVHRRDAYEALGAFIPARTPRLLVLIDPSYEDKDEYHQAPAQLLRAVQRARHATYVLWYPLLPAARHHALLADLKAACNLPVLRCELHLRPARGEGMYGSGMVVINPPWQLDAILEQAGPALAHQLAKRDGRFNYDWLVAEGTTTTG